MEPNNHSSNDVPLPSAQPLEIDFIQNRQDSFPDELTTFDSSRQQFVPQLNSAIVRQTSFDLPPPEEHTLHVAQTTESFRKAVERLKVKEGKKNAIIKEFSFEKAEGWNDIAQIINSAQKKYLADNTVSGKVRAFFRKVGDSGKSIKPFVDLLPDGNYKTLCGGLTLILSAMVGHSDIREKMAELMAELPEDVQEAEHYSLMYQGSNMLRQRIEELYVEILKAMEDFVKWYTEGTARHVRDSLLKNTSYPQAIDNRIRAIRRSRLLFQQTTTKLFHRRGQLTHEAVVRTGRVLEESQKDIKVVGDAIEDAKKGVQETGDSLMRRMSGLESKMLNGLSNVLGEQTRNAKWQKEVEDLRRETLNKDRIIAELRNRVTAASHTSSSLASTLGLDLSEDIVNDDVDLAYSIGAAETTSFQGRARWVAESPKFSDWMKANSSSVLLVEGNAILENLSAMSFLASMLHQKLVMDDNVLVLPFFCGLHRGSRFKENGEFSGPQLMVRALLSQLLCIENLDQFRGEDDLPLLLLEPDQVKKMKRGSFSAYMSLISKLVTILRRRYSAIFVIIDGIDWYDLPWKKNVKRTARAFSRLVRMGTESSGVLKVLFSAATHFSDWTEGLTEATMLDIPTDIWGNESAFRELER